MLLIKAEAISAKRIEFSNTKPIDYLGDWCIRYGMEQDSMH